MSAGQAEVPQVVEDGLATSVQVPVPLQVRVMQVVEEHVRLVPWQVPPEQVSL